MRPVASAVAAAVAVTLVAGVAATPLAAQDAPASGGGSRRPRFIVAGGISHASQTPGAKFLQMRGGTTLTTGFAQGYGSHLALGVAIPVTRSAIELRVEGFYNAIRNRATPGYEWLPGDTLRFATRDRSVGGLATLVWHAFPSHTFTPYLLTGLGYYRSNLEHEPSAEDPVRMTASTGNLGHSYGLGLRVPVASRVFHVELRKHVITNDEPMSGANFAPFTVGMRF